MQIVKEPISTKGPRLTSELSFAGRYLVLIPFNDKVSVSQKIKSSEERARLKQLLMSIKPKNFGVIVRTVAEGKRVAELDGELKVLVKHWEDAMVKVQKATKYPTLIYEETSRAVGLLRDLFNPSFENIHVNDEAVYNEIRDYVSLIAPDRANIVKLYKGQLPIYDNFGITKQIKSSFGKTVSYNIVEVVYDSNLTLERLPEVCRTYTIEKAIVATVIDLSREVLSHLRSTSLRRELCTCMVFREEDRHRFLGIAGHSPDDKQ